LAAVDFGSLQSCSVELAHLLQILQSAFISPVTTDRFNTVGSSGFHSFGMQLTSAFGRPEIMGTGIFGLSAPSAGAPAAGVFGASSGAVGLFGGLGGIGGSGAAVPEPAGGLFGGTPAPAAAGTHARFVVPSAPQFSPAPDIFAGAFPQQAVSAGASSAQHQMHAAAPQASGFSPQVAVGAFGVAVPQSRFATSFFPAPQAGFGAAAVASGFTHQARAAAAAPSACASAPSFGCAGPSEWSGASVFGAGPVPSFDAVSSGFPSPQRIVGAPGKFTKEQSDKLASCGIPCVCRASAMP
jgi:hypothetical protein